jgi:hypothetical protein
MDGGGGDMTEGVETGWIPIYIEAHPPLPPPASTTPDMIDRPPCRHLIPRRVVCLLLIWWRSMRLQVQRQPCKRLPPRSPRLRVRPPTQRRPMVIKRTAPVILRWTNVRRFRRRRLRTRTNEIHVMHHSPTPTPHTHSITSRRSMSMSHTCRRPATARIRRTTPTG